MGRAIKFLRFGSVRYPRVRITSNLSEYVATVNWIWKYPQDILYFWNLSLTRLSPSKCKEYRNITLLHSVGSDEVMLQTLNHILLSWVFRNMIHGVITRWIGV